MNEEMMKHTEEMRTIRMWLHSGAITYEYAQKLAKPHLEAMNARSREMRSKIPRNQFQFFHALASDFSDSSDCSASFIAAASSSPSILHLEAALTGSPFTNTRIFW